MGCSWGACYMLGNSSAGPLGNFGLAWHVSGHENVVISTIWDTSVFLEKVTGCPRALRDERGAKIAQLCMSGEISSAQDSDTFSLNSAASQPDCQCDSRLLSTGLPHEPGRTGFPPSLRSGLGSAFLLPTPVCPAAFQWLPGIRKGWRGSPASWCQCHDRLWVSCWLEKGSLGHSFTLYPNAIVLS